MPSLADMAAGLRKASKNQTQKKTVNQKSLPTLLKSAEHVSQSDIESETESEDDSSSDDEPAKVIPPVTKVNGTVTEATTSSSTSKSDDDNESSEEDSSDGSSESDSEEEEDDESLPEVPDVIAASSARDSITPAPIVLAGTKSSAVYTPPPGFEPLKTNQGQRTKASELFSPSNLTGRQIWYITAPASVPISAIKKVSLKDAQGGKPALSHNGEEYGFVQNEVEDNRYSRIMLPDEAGSSYHLARNTIGQSLHLQQLVRLPSSSSQGTGAQTTSRATVPAKRPVRQQPEGLKMRFRPIGHADSEDENLRPFLHEAVQKSKPTSAKVVSGGTSSEDDSSGSDQEMYDALADPAERPKLSEPKASTEENSSSDDEHVAKKTTTKKSTTKRSSQTLSKRKHSDLKDNTNVSPVPSTKENQPKKKKTEESSKPAKHTAIPPPRSFSILPFPDIAQAPVPSASGTLPETNGKPPKDKTGVKKQKGLPDDPERNSQSTPRPKDKKDNDKTLEERIAAIDPSLDEAARLKEIKRLQNNESSRISRAKKRQAQLSETNGESPAPASSTAIPPPPLPIPVPGKRSSTTTPQTAKAAKKPKVNSTPVLPSSSQPVPEETPSKRSSIIPPPRITSILPHKK